MNQPKKPSVSPLTTYVVHSVGEPMGQPVTVDAYSDHNAVAAVSGCLQSLVGIPIWARITGGPQSPAVLERCYMPRDNTGRQWIVRTDPPATQ